MTEKRFKLRLSKLGNGMITDTQKRENLYFDKEFLDATLPTTTEWLNELANENEQLKTKNNAYIQDIEVFKEENTHLKLENEQLKDDVYDWKASAEDYLKLGKSLKRENEQLKERNNRQCRQLDNLYTLIEKQDWKTLTGLIQEFQECEEQLQKEWRTYGDLE